MTGSKNLIELPDFSTAKGLEELIVEGCMRLHQTPESLMGFYNLTKLNAIHCDILRGVRFRVNIDNTFSSGDSRRTITEMRFHFLKDLSIKGQIFIQSMYFWGQTEDLSLQHIPDQSTTMKQTPVSPQVMPSFKGPKLLQLQGGSLSFPLLQLFKISLFDRAKADKLKHPRHPRRHHALAIPRETGPRRK